MSNYIYPADFNQWQLTNPSPEQQVAYFNDHPETRMPTKQWETFYCSSTEHKGFHCSSCISDQDYGFGGFDDECCCLSNKLKGL